MTLLVILAYTWSTTPYFSNTIFFYLESFWINFPDYPSQTFSQHYEDILESLPLGHFRLQTLVD